MSNVCACDGNVDNLNAGIMISICHCLMFKFVLFVSDSAYLSSTKNNVSLEYDETVSAISNQRQLTAKDEANKPMLDPVVLAVQSQKELPSAIAKSSRYYEASPVFGEHESKVDEIEAENLVIVPEEEDHEHASESDPNLTELQQTGPASNGLLGLCPSVLVPRSGSLDAMMPDKTTPSNMTKLRIVQNFFRYVPIFFLLHLQKNSCVVEFCMYQRSLLNLTFLRLNCGMIGVSKMVLTQFYAKSAGQVAHTTIITIEMLKNL